MRRRFGNRRLLRRAAQLRSQNFARVALPQARQRPGVRAGRGHGSRAGLATRLHSARLYRELADEIGHVGGGEGIEITPADFRQNVVGERAGVLKHGRWEHSLRGEI